jgi:hypothetical protein
MVLAIAASSASGQVLPPQSHAYGYSYQEWSSSWWQWTLEQSTNDLELVGAPNLKNGAGSHVRFLAGIYEPGSGGISVETRNVTIPSGTPLFFPILSIWVDNGGCNGTNLAFTSLTADQLAAEAAGIWSAVTSTTCTIDGVPVAGLSNPATTGYLVASTPFSYTTAAQGSVVANLFGEPCIPGGLTVYPAVADGVYLMLPPLSVGSHVIHFVGVVGPVSAPFVEDDITYNITVTPGN